MIPIGFTFGQWTVIGPEEKSIPAQPHYRPKQIYLCRCSCGREKHQTKFIIEHNQSQMCIECLYESRRKRKPKKVKVIQQELPDLCPWSRRMVKGTAYGIEAQWDIGINPNVGMGG
jgi:hypothetical protein